MTEAEGRSAVLHAAQSWLGTPYHHRARVKGAGVDCGQLIAAVFHEAGLIDEVEEMLYPRDWMFHRSEERFLHTVERYAVKVNRLPKPADILLFQVGRTLSHGAIVLDYPTIIHARAEHGVIHSNMDQEPDLQDHLRGVWTCRGWT